jgi:hypothetical protein
MNMCAGLDVSVEETSICVVDESGRVIRELKVATEPDASPRHSQLSADPGSASALKPDHCHSGCSAGWSRQAIR